MKKIIFNVLFISTLFFTNDCGQKPDYDEEGCFISLIKLGYQKEANFLLQLDRNLMEGHYTAFSAQSLNTLDSLIDHFKMAEPQEKLRVFYAKCLRIKSGYLQFSVSSDSAILLLNKALKFLSEQKNNTIFELAEKADILNYLGEIYLEDLDYISSISCLNTSTSINEKLNRRLEIVKNLNMIARSQAAIGLNQDANVSLNRTQKILKNYADTMEIIILKYNAIFIQGMVNQSVARNYILDGDFAKANIAYFQAKEFLKQLINLVKSDSKNRNILFAAQYNLLSCLASQLSLFSSPYNKGFSTETIVSEIIKIAEDAIVQFGENGNEYFLPFLALGKSMVGECKYSLDIIEMVLPSLKSKFSQRTSNPMSASLRINGTAIAGYVYNHCYSQNHQDELLIMEGLKNIEYGLNFIDSLKISTSPRINLENMAGDLIGQASRGVLMAQLLWERKPHDEKLVERALAITEKSKAFGLKQEIDNLQKERLYTGEKKLLLEKDKKMFNELKRLSNSDLSKDRGKFDSLSMQYKDFLLELKNSADFNEKSYYFTRYNYLVPNLSEIRSTIINNDSTAIIEYQIGVDYGIIIGISRNQSVMFKLNIDPKFYQNLDLFYSLKNSKENLKFQELCEELGEVLFAPANNWLESQGISELIIIPDKRLTGINFEVLNTKARKNPLLQNFYISQHYSLSAMLGLLALDKIRNKNAGLLGMFSGTPFLGKTFGYSKLKSLNKQIENTKKKYGDKVNLFNDDYSKNTFINNANSQKVIHLLAHGDFDEITNRPVIMFLPKNNQPEYLTLPEISNLDCNAKLTVMVNCHSGHGSYDRGEGVISFVRAFLGAGSTAVIGATFELLDKDAAEILTYFYDGILENNLSANVALTLAKRRYLTQNTKKNHPYFWSSLVYYGPPNLKIKIK